MTIEEEMQNEDILREAALPLRISMLEEAARLTGGDRRAAYGDPVENYAHTAAIFNAMTGRDLSAREAALMLVAVKIARLAQNHTHRDSYVDAMAYLGIAAECAQAAR